MTNLKGRLGRIFNNPIVDEHLSKGDILGYLTHDNRTKDTDMILEGFLRQEFKNAFEDKDHISDNISKWMFSPLSMFFMDECNTSQEFLDKIIPEINKYSSIS